MQTEFACGPGGRDKGMGEHRGVGGGKPTPIRASSRLRRGACGVLDTVPLWGRGKEGVLTAAARRAARKMWKTGWAAILSI
jgi:hypothetical protein